MRSGRKPPAARQHRPSAPFAAQAKRWTSAAPRREQKSFQDLKKDYDRYLALAVLKLKMEIRSRQRIITNTLNTISGRCPQSPKKRGNQALRQHPVGCSERPSFSRWLTSHRFCGELIMMFGAYTGALCPGRMEASEVYPCNSRPPCISESMVARTNLAR